MAKEFLEGNFAMAEAAVRAGVEAYFGYPITPQTELLEWMSHRMPELKRVFLQAESEVAFKKFFCHHDSPMPLPLVIWQI